MSVEGGPCSPMSRGSVAWVSIGIQTLAVAVLMLLHVSASLWSASRESATYDEVQHIGPGYARLALHDYRLTPIAAPLMPMLAGLAVSEIHPRLPVVDDPFWNIANGAAFGYRFLYGQGESRRLVWLARLPFVALSAALALAIFAWGKQLWGTASAFGALFLYAINPELLAHSHYANLDLGISLVTTLALWALYSFLRSPTLGRGAMTVAAFALAPVTKYSFPLVFLMGASVAFASFLDKRIREEHGGALRLSKQLLLLGVAVAMAAWLVVWAAFGFKTQEGASPDLSNPVPLEQLVPEGSVRVLLGAIRDRHLLPDGFVHGIAQTIHLPQSYQMTFYHGLSAPGGWWYFFPMVLLLKTPLPLLLLLASTLIIRGPETHPPLAAAAVALPAAVYLACAISFGFSIGYRHLLPILPLLCLWGGRQVSVLWGRYGLRPIAVLLLSWYALGTYRVAPHFLSFFNELAGGPERGYHYLVDSNCDWGQDLDELARLCQRLDLKRVNLSYFGSASPDDAGIPYLALPSVTCCWQPQAWTTSLGPGDVVAVSVTNLMGVYFHLPGASTFPIRVNFDGVPRVMPLTDALTYLQRHYRPFARAGYSILLYRIDPSDRIDAQ